ncbi:Protein sidekick-2 [Liparis tanakae]|uniref:Protein sidekick-2 n=1 Tax=Liparis tanakae TaxID=230148 RepID=A0A4Z2F5R7_9TELE|nr:Protein sidekick-2 [Liparis tanakae]
MYCGNHGNNAALSIKVSRCNISQQEADGDESSAGPKSQIGERNREDLLSLPIFLLTPGEGGVIPAPRIRSFPQPQVTWFRDGRKIPPSSRM